MPEKLVQEQAGFVELTVQNLAKEVHRYLKEHDLQPDLIWGFSLGGMIAQELSVLEGMEEIPLLLVSTNAYADMTLQAVFSAWAQMTHSFGEAGFQRSLGPWIVKSEQLPIVTADEEWNGVFESNPLAIAKATSSLRAVALHDARPRLPQIQSPVLVLFGEQSVLLHEAHAQVFREHLPHAQVVFLANAGMRLMGDNPEGAISRIKSYIGANVK
jgi:pimeloyl-ACP methyl ester carboxylesterase